jgi:hypothetical protein
MTDIRILNPDKLIKRANRTAQHLREGTERQPTSFSGTNFLEENKHTTGQDFVDALLNHVFPSNGSSRG